MNNKAPSLHTLATAAFIALSALTLAAPATAMPSQTAPQSPEQARKDHTVCTSCGTIEAVDTIERKAPAVGPGGVLGALLGNSLERDTPKETFFRVHVRMEDGKLLAFDQPARVEVGTQVVVLNNALTLRPAQARPTGYRRDDPLEDHYRRYREL